MRYIFIDLSSDNHLQQPKIFGGYSGEHNETVLQVKLPSRMIGIECSGYRFDFQTSEDNKISSPLIPISELNDDVLSFHLVEQLTIAGNLLFNVVAILSNETTVSLVSKTNTVVLCIEDSPEGNVQLADPNGYKDELQKMIDERILEINPAKVDQTYAPTSKNAQSGKAVAEAVSDKQDSLVSGTNIKTINNQSILGSGNITIEGGSDIEVDQNYNPTSENAQSGKAVAEAVTTEQNHADNTFANALKGTKSDTAILLDDISPVSHEMRVKISSDTVTDLTAVKVKRCGKNIVNIPTIDINGGNGTIPCYITKPITISGINDNVVVQNNNGVTANIWRIQVVYADGTAGEMLDSMFSSSKTFNHIEKPSVDIPIIAINYRNIYIRSGKYKNIQVEYGTTATDYEPYICKEYTPTVDGTVNGVTSLYPNTTLTPDTEGVIIDCEYNRDINKAFAALEAAIATNNS